MGNTLESPAFELLSIPSGIQRSLEGINLDPDSRGTINFQKDLAQIRSLQQRFNEALGIQATDKEIIMSYNPVLARWKYERLITLKEKEQFKTYELQQLQTALRERYRSSESQINYHIGKDNKLYNELFPDEPFEDVLKRGLFYRKEHGSPELEREEAEVEGFLNLSRCLTDLNTQLGTKITVISPPGLVKGTTYKDNFVDVYELAKNPQTGLRMIKMTRHSSSMSYEDYYNELAKINPGLLKNIQGPFDALLLKTLIKGEISIKEKGISEALISQINSLTFPWKLRYLDALCAEPFNPHLIAETFDYLLRVGDLVKAGKHHRIRAILQGDVNVAAGFIRNLPILPVASGCGMSGGFGLGEFLGGMVSNSVAKFGLLEDEYGSLFFTCPAEDCKKTNIRPRGGFRERCQHCNKEIPRC